MAVSLRSCIMSSLCVLETGIKDGKQLWGQVAGGDSAYGNCEGHDGDSAQHMAARGHQHPTVSALCLCYRMAVELCEVFRCKTYPGDKE